MNEIWKDIDGFDGLYQVSNLGRIKSNLLRNGWGTFKKETIMCQTDNGHGYLIVHLHKQNKRYSKYVHRLVAEAFCEKPEGCNVVNHIDFDKKNNEATNLEWCTTQANIHYSSNRMKRKIKGTTGEVCIYKIGDAFRVVVKGIEYKRQKTIEDAIALRDAVMKGAV